MPQVLRRVATLCAAIALTAALPVAAQAATLTNAGGTLTYTAAPGTSSDLSLDQAVDATVTVTRNSFDSDPITPDGCVADPDPDVYDCPGVTTIVLDLGDGEDYAFASDVQVPIALSGGTGSDGLGGGAAPDTVVGGAGDDFIESSTGADVYVGGSGIDAVFYFTAAEPPATGAPAVSITLDGIANDGFAGEGKNFATDVEDVKAESHFFDGVDPAFGPVTITGSAVANRLEGFEGNDTLTGAAGNDQLYGEGGDDALQARDGFGDRVACGSGTDAVTADTLDQVADDCENISIADVGNAGEDKPPTVAWAAPAAAARLTASRPTTLQVNATDDKGVVQVQFLDDDRVVCTDTVAPYTCAYQPRGEDVGRNTLIALATDAAGQSASSVRAVRVNRFAARRLSLAVKPGRDTTSPFTFRARGRLSLPTALTATLGCKGSVKVSIKAGRKVLATRKVKLSRGCSYKARMSLASRRRFAANGKLTIRARFAGNDVVGGKRSARRTVKTER